MAFSKAHKFDDAVRHAALLCNALSHPARIVMLKRIIEAHGEPLTAGQLMANLPISRQTATGHLKMLRDMSIVNCVEKTPYIYYSLNTDLINTCACIFSMVCQAESKFDEKVATEIPVVEARRTIGTAPI